MPKKPETVITITEEDHDEEFQTLSTLVKKEIKRDETLKKSYAMSGFFLAFQSPEAETRYQNHINNTQSLKKNFLFAIFFLILLLGSHIRGHFISVREDRIWIGYALRGFMTAYACVISFLLGVPAFKSFEKRIWASLKQRIFENQHILLSSLFFVSSSIFSFLFFTHEVSQGLQWKPHAIIIFAMFVMVRVRWTLFIASGFVQAILFGVCASTAGFDRNEIGEISAFLGLVSIIGLLGVLSVEHSSRTLFAQQEISLIVVQRNARALKQLAAKTQEADEAKSRFIANISHEIRTPLHGVITALDLLKGSGGMTPEQEEYIQVAETSSGLLLDILNNVLTISKLQAGMVALESKFVDLRAIVENVAVVFSQIASRKGVEVAAYVPPSCPVHILSDSIHLKQILFNLMSNAVKFTPKGSVQIHVEAEEGTETEHEVTLTVRVKDSGIGVAKEHLHLLFQRFSQVDESSTRKFQGTGLGLALVHEFSKLFNGNISVHSDGLGNGTTFSFTARFQKSLEVQPPSTSNPFICNPIQRPVFSQPTIGWVSIVMHNLPEVGDICSKYLKYFGFDSTVVPPHSEILDLSEFVKSRMYLAFDTMKDNFLRMQENVCVPLCVVLDHPLCSDSKVLESIEILSHLAHEMSLTKRTPNCPNFDPCPLFVLILDDPARLSVGDRSGFYFRNSLHVWSIKKPCRLHKLLETIHSMHEFLASELHRTKSQPRRLSLAENKYAGPSPSFTLGGRFSKSTHVPPAASGSSSSSRHKAGVDPQTLGSHKNSKYPHPDQFFHVTSSGLAGGEGLVHSEPPSLPFFQHASQTGEDSLSNGESLPETPFLQMLISDQAVNGMFISPTTGARPTSAKSLVSNLSSTHHHHHHHHHHSNRTKRRDTVTSVSVSPTTISSPAVTPSAMAMSKMSEDAAMSDMHISETHKRILIADDNAINRKLTERLLAKAGFHCTCVEDGAQAVDAAMRNSFAVIFMDITMPVMDGCTATTIIKHGQTDKNVVPRTFICALSAAESERFTADFDGVLPKPVKSEELIGTARRFSDQWLQQYKRRESRGSQESNTQ